MQIAYTQATNPLAISSVANNPDISFAGLIEKISKALEFLDTKDVGPWVQK